MLIASHCVGFRQCRPYCPVGAIVTAPDVPPLIRINAWSAAPASVLPSAP